MASVKTPPYKQFLTPALHRRFTGAAVVILAICYVEAVLIGEKTSFFWSWFPIGTAGIKTLLLFIAALSVFVLRVAQLHLGARTAPSPFATSTRYLLRLDTIQTLGWYLFSAWWFSEVYVWSAAQSSNLGWIAQGKSWERRMLNERPIYLRSVFFIFAITQSYLHLYYDYDQVALSTAVPAKPEPVTEEQIGLVAGVKAQWLAQIKPLQPLFWYDANDLCSSITRNIVLRAVAVSFFSPFIYAIFIRRTTWSWSLSFAKLVWDVPPTSLSYIPPHYPSLILRSLTSGFFLLLLWEASNALFTAYVAKSPLKNGQAFTAESKDPNGSLLTGLKSRKEIPKTFALWELFHISSHPTPRRTTIFTDIDRPTGPFWTQILAITLSQISAIHTRIKPPTTSSSPQAARSPIPIETLPRLTAPLRHENILTKPPKPSTTSDKTEAIIGGIAKSFGQSPIPGTLKLPSGAENQVRQMMTQKILPSSPSSSQKLLTADTGSSPQEPSRGLLATAQGHLLTFLRSPLGIPFRHTLPRRARAIILGSPHSSFHQIIYSIRTLNHLALASLTEDPYGKVAQDIPSLIRTYVSTIRAIEAFVRELDVHWTDVKHVDETGTRKEAVDDVDEVIRALRQGLQGFVEGFGRFAIELGMDAGEVSVAKEVAAKGIATTTTTTTTPPPLVDAKQIPGLERREMEELRA